MQLLRPTVFCLEENPVLSSNSGRRFEIDNSSSCTSSEYESGSDISGNAKSAAGALVYSQASLTRRYSFCGDSISSFSGDLSAHAEPEEAESVDGCLSDRVRSGFGGPQVKWLILDSNQNKPSEEVESLAQFSEYSIQSKSSKKSAKKRIHCRVIGKDFGSAQKLRKVDLVAERVTL